MSLVVVSLASGLAGNFFESVQHGVLNRQSELLLEVGEVDIEHDLLAGRLQYLEPHTEIVEQHFGRHRLDGIRTGGVGGLDIWQAATQLEGALQIDRATDPLGLVAHLFVGVSEQLFGLLVLRVGEQRASAPPLPSGTRPCRSRPSPSASPRRRRPYTRRTSSPPASGGS